MSIIDEVGTGVGDDHLVGESAEKILIAGVKEADNVALDVHEFALAKAALAGVGGPRRGRDRGLGGLTVVARLVGGLLEVGVDGLAERDVLFFMVAFVRSLGMDMGWRITFGSFGLWRSVRLVRGALLRVAQWWQAIGLLFIVATDFLSEVIVQLLEADMLVVEELGVDTVEVGRVPSAEVLNVLSGEINAGGELALVLLLGRLDEGRCVLLDRRKLLGVQLHRQEAWCILILGHMKRAVSLLMIKS